VLRIFVYVDGSDLEQVEAVLLRAFEDFTASWGVESVKLINDKHNRTSDLGPDDLPDWNLGLNVEVDSLPREKIETLMRFLSKIAAKTDREFVIGAWRTKTMVSEDWCFVGAEVKQNNIDFLAEQLHDL
jgi:hypothetical protein